MLNGKDLIIEDNIEKYPYIIRNLVNNKPLADKISINGRKLVEEKYDWKLYSSSMKKIYQNVLDDR